MDLATTPFCKLLKSCIWDCNYFFLSREEVSLTSANFCCTKSTFSPAFFLFFLPVFIGMLFLEMLLLTLGNKIWLWSPCLKPNFSISPPHSCSSTVFLETNLSMGKHSKVIVPLSKGKKIQRNKEPTCPNWILHVLCTTVIPFSAKTIFLKVSNHYQDLGRHVPILTGRLLGDLHMQYKIHCNLHFHHHFHQLTTNHPLTARLHFHSPF